MVDAPLFSDLAQGPCGGRAFWLTASDGIRLRMALWSEGGQGTIVLLPGRTEYIEKYGQAVAEFSKRGYAVAVIDWRGQGLSDRADPDRMLGHVQDFQDYQKDIAAILAKLHEVGQPGPFYMVSHSMGGCIGLRALMQAHSFKAAAFSAPMWGIRFAPGVAPVARILSRSARAFGQGQRYAPGTSAKTYVITAPFEGNVLTCDPERFAMMQAQLNAQPDLALGGPSMNWLDVALQECRELAARPSPDLPVYCALGAGEKVVDPAAVHARMARWPKAGFDLIPHAEHEIMMEIPATRTRFFDAATALFGANP